MSANIIRYGSEADLPPRRYLCAGPLSAVYEAGDLRYIRFGKREVIRRVYVAVRDHNWGTIAPKIRDEHITQTDDSFAISYAMTHQQNEIDFVWRGTISGTADGTIRFRMDGEARSAFQTNRVGFCVLHPADCAGAHALVEHTDGAQDKTAFPQLIAPQHTEGGRIHPVYPFAEMQALAHEVEPGVWCQIRFAGDIFELEDQRNWIDGSFKTYCRPLRLPFPYKIEAEQHVWQTVGITINNNLGAQNAKRKTQNAEQAQHGSSFPTSSFILHPSSSSPLPTIGLGAASHAEPLSTREIERLRVMRLAHLRVDVPLFEASALPRLQLASDEAQAVGVPLEIALFLSDDADAELKRLRAYLDEAALPVARWLVFHHDETTTSTDWVRRVRAVLGDYAPTAPFASGTNAYFTELNRERPDTAALDMLTYSVNPQVHAFDNASLVECAATISMTVVSAQS